MTVLVTAMLFALQEAPSLREIGKVRARVACDSCPGARYRVQVDFQLDIVRPDLALDTAFLPVVETRGKFNNLLHWGEEVTHGGPRYRIRFYHHEVSRTGGPRVDVTQQTYVYDERNAWKFHPDFQGAVQDDGGSRGTRVLQDYYGDMIGAELAGISRVLARTVPSPTHEPYDIDRVIGSGIYRVSGSEVVADEPCVLIERPGWDRVWLAMYRGYAVVRREWRWSEGGPIKRQITNRDWREVADGAWLPHQGRMEILGHPSTLPGQLVGVLHATVREATGIVDDATFQPGFPKGTSVLNLENGRTFPFGLNSAELDELERRKIERSAAHPELARFAYKPAAWWARPVTWLAGIAALVVGVAIVFWWRKTP